MDNRVPYDWGKRIEFFREYAHSTPMHSDLLQMRVKVYATGLYVLCCGFKAVVSCNQNVPDEYRDISSRLITRVFLVDLHSTVEAALRELWRRLEGRQAPLKLGNLLGEFADRLSLSEHVDPISTFEALTRLRNTMHSGFVPLWDYRGKIGDVEFEIKKGQELLIAENEFDRFVDAVVMGTWESAREFDEAIAELFADA